MTATSDFVEFAARPRPLDNLQKFVRRFIRVIQAVLGGGTIIGAALLWIMPGSQMGPDIGLLKMGLSIMAWMSGALMLYAALRPEAVEQIDIDLVRREVRVRGAGGLADIQICRFNKLGRAELNEGVVSLWGPDGAYLADVAVHEPDVQRLLVSALRDAGKL